ncbi:putative uncharacterized protein [Burkholderiales bacterium GJ-E10]|nr:putative uncharacterized protein [Burkholderiales bacterium GJ-E10]
MSGTADIPRTRAEVLHSDLRTAVDALLGRLDGIESGAHLDFSEISAILRVALKEHAESQGRREFAAAARIEAAVAKANGFSERLEKLDSLLDLAENADNQKEAIQAAIDAITRERASLAKASTAVAASANAVKESAGQVAPAIAKASTAVFNEIRHAADQAIEDLSSAVRGVREAESVLDSAGKSFTWKWFALAGSAAASSIAAIAFGAWLSVWWQRHQVEDLAAEKVQLVSDVAKLRASAAAWTNRAGRANLSSCGKPARICVRVDKTAGEFGDANAQYYVIFGY